MRILVYKDILDTYHKIYTKEGKQKIPKREEKPQRGFNNSCMQSGIRIITHSLSATNIWDRKRNLSSSPIHKKVSLHI